MIRRDAVHPGVRPLQDAYRRGQLARRDFLRAVALLGVPVAVAGRPAQAMAPVAGTPVVPKYGGSLRMACRVEQMDNPAIVSWFEVANVFRNSLEYLTRIDADNITRPYLAESWLPSADLRVWEFRLRRRVRWSNGDPFDSRDVAATIGMWLAPDSESVNKTSFAMISGVEIVDAWTIRLHLSRPTLALPEMLFAPTCPMLHRSFATSGRNWPEAPIGTGPYRLARFLVGEEAVLARRDDYWGAKPYLDTLRFIDLGTNVSTHLAALDGGQLDLLYKIDASDLPLATRLPGVQIISAHAAQTVCMRMQVDQAPFHDIRVRRAVQASADLEAILRLGYGGAGTMATNCHAAPLQTDYVAIAAPKRDLDLARHLLREAGHAEGIDLTLMVGNTQGVWEQNTAQVFQQNCAEAGIRIRLNVIPPNEYMTIWNRMPFGLTFWAHRPLAMMTYDIAYRSKGPWNETHFADPAFDAALDRAMSTTDPLLHDTAMRQAETILQQAALFVQPFWMNKYTAASARVRDYRLNAGDCFDLAPVWLA